MSSQSTMYRADPRRHLIARATRTASAIAATLAAIGALALIAGLAGALGLASIDALNSAFDIGLGLLSGGASALLLLIIHTPQEP